MEVLHEDGAAVRDSVRPELSIIIVSYQCRDLLLTCLASVEETSSDVTHEVIVVDNASTDGTAEAVTGAHSAVRLIRAPGNEGFSVANNMAMGVAKGEFILLLNPDTRVQAGALRAAVDEIRARPKIGMLGVKLVQEDGRLDHAAKRGFPTPLSALAYFVRVSRLLPRSRVALRYVAGHIGEDEIAEVDAINGAFMLVRREAVDDVGLLDEDYWLYMEDLDWCYRFWAQGWPVLYWPAVTITHLKGGSSSSGRSWRANQAFHRGMWIFYSKHYFGRYPRAVGWLIRLSIEIKLYLSAARSLVRRYA